MSAAPTKENNAALRALFSFPAVVTSASTALTVPEMPAPKEVTGDRELDAVLWLQECVATGHPDLIAKALDAAKRIKTPMAQLADRYDKYLLSRSGGNIIAAVFGSMSFGKLESRAKDAVDRLAQRHRALSMFGTVDNLLSDTPAEIACKVALQGMKRRTTNILPKYNTEKADARFLAHPALAPHSLEDCLHGMQYLNELYWLRHKTVEDVGDHWPAVQEYEDFCFRQLAHIRPRSKEEALAVLESLDEDAIQRKEVPAILRNLVTGGWA